MGGLVIGTAAGACLFAVFVYLSIWLDAWADPTVAVGVVALLVVAAFGCVWFGGWINQR